MAVDAFDLDTIFALRALYDVPDPASPPSIATFAPPGPCRAVALLPGSFNPPTAAHMLLGERALSEGFDCVLLLLARNTVGKEPSGLIAEDRLLAMRAAANSTLGVAVGSHGLYADQAEAARALYPNAEIAFLVGSDKVVQIFQSDWYEDRDEALERLFGLAHLVVAPRSDQGELLREVLEARENRRFADAVSVLRLHPAVSDLSSTRVRGLLRSGAAPAGLVPPSVAELLSAMRAFAPPIVIGDEEIDAYRMRAKLIEALWRERDGAARGADLRRLVATALSPTREGARLRDAVSNGWIHTEDVMRAHAAGM